MFDKKPKLLSLRVLREGVTKEDMHGRIIIEIEGVRYKISHEDLGKVLGAEGVGVLELET